MPYSYSSVYLKGKKYELSEQAKQLLVSINTAEYSKKNGRELYATIADALDTTNGIDILLEYNYQSKIPEYGDQWNYPVEQDSIIVRLSLNQQTGYVDASSTYSNNWKTEKITNEWGSWWYTYPDYNSWLSTKVGSEVPEINTSSGKVIDSSTGTIRNNTQAESILNSVNISLFGRAGYTQADLERTISDQATGNLYATSTYLGGSNGDIHYPDISITTQSASGNTRKVILEKSQNVHDIAVDGHGNIYIVHDKVVLPASWDPTQPGAWEQVTNKSNLSIIEKTGTIRSSELPGSRQQLVDPLNSPVWYDYYFSKDNSGNIFVNESKQPTSAGTDWHLTTTKWRAEEYAFKGTSAVPVIATFRLDTGTITDINSSTSSGNTIGFEGRGKYNAFSFAYTDSIQLADKLQSVMGGYIGNLKLTYEYPEEVAPTYSLTPSGTTINEGSTLTTSIATTNVASGTTLYYALSGTGISAADFSSGALTGQVSIGSNGSASFSHTLANDLTTEGAETLQIKLFSDSARTLQVGSAASVTITDTSTTPAPTYSLTPSVTTINEGATLTTSITTTNVPSGTTLYYDLSGTGISAADFSSGSLNGPVTVSSNGSASFSHTLASDLTTEGPETLQIELFTDTARTIQVGSTASVAITDTSTAPKTNNLPTGTPTLSGTLKAGQVITIDKTPIQDTDNFTGYTPEFKYSWEVSSNGTTWTPLTTADATDNNTTYTLTTAEVGKQVRGVVSYLDGYGTQESVTSSASATITSSAPPNQSLTLTAPSKSAIRAGTNTTSAISYTVSTGETNLTGVGASLYFDSTQLAVTTAGEPFQKGLIGNAIVADTNNADGDPKTDKVLALTYADFGGNFPGSGTTLPLTLANLNLVPTSSYSGTTLHLKGSPATGFTATGADLTLGYNASPVVNSTLPALTTNRGSAFAYTFRSDLFTDLDSPLTLSATTSTGTALPSWLSFNPATRTLSGTPTTGGTLNLNLSASDELGSVSTPLSIKVREVQQLSSSATTIRYQRNKNFTLPINYSTTDGSSSTGLAFKVHFNSSLFTFDPTTGVSNKLAAAGLFEVGAVQQDTGDSDNDATTDQYIPISIASFTGQLPSGSKLADLTFRTADKAIDPLTGLKDTSINFTETAAASGYGFSGTSASLKPLSFNLDVDGDGLVTPLGDGLMVIRYLFGNAFAGDALINKAISPDSPLLGGKSYASMNATEKAGVASLVATNIQQGIDSKLLDVDGDGKTTPLGDGLMVIRRLFGNAFAGSALTSKAISPESPYFSDPNAHLIVASNIDALKPTPILI